MPIRSPLILALLLSGLACRASEEPEGPSPEALRTAKELVRALGDDDYATRDRASAGLAALPESVMPFLLEMLKKAQDPEVAVRLRRVVLPWQAAQLREALSLRKLSFEFVGTPLGEGLVYLSKATGIRMELAPEIRAEGGAQLLLSLKVRDMPGTSVLKWIERLSDLEAYPQADGMSFNSRGLHRSDLLARRYSLEGTGFEAYDVADLLRSRLLAHRFADPHTSIATEGSTLVAIHNAETHQELERMVGALRQAKDRRVVRLGEPEPEWRKEMRKVLGEKTVSFEFVDVGLDKVIEFFAGRVPCSWVLDPRVVQAGLPSISLRVTDMKADSALAWAMKLCDLEYDLQDHAVFITKRTSVCGWAPCLGIYDVRELLEPAKGITAQALADMLRNRAHPESWDPNLGTGMEECSDRLFVMQNEKVHMRIERLLEAFRSFREQVRKVEPDGRPPEVPLPPGAAPIWCDANQEEELDPEQRNRRLALEEKLQRPISLEVAQRPLREMLKEIQERSALEIRTDHVGNDCLGQPVTLRLDKLPAGEVLRWALQMADLRFDVEHGAARVLASKSARLQVQLAVIYVADLGTVLPAPDWAALIQERLFPMQFRDPATSIQESQGKLVIMQTPETIQKVVRILDHVRGKYAQPVLALNDAADSKDERAFKTALRQAISSEKKIEAGLKQATIHQAADSLRQHLGGNWVVGRELAGRLPEITIEPDRIPARGLLSKVLEQAGAHVEFEGQVAVLAQGNDLLYRVELRLYRLDDLRENGVSLNPETVAERIRTEIAPDSWDPNQNISLELRGNWLCIMNEPAVHARIEKQLQAWRAPQVAPEGPDK